MFDPGEAGYNAPDPFGTDRELSTLAAERASAVLDPVVERIEDVPVESVHEVGHPARVIVDYARREDIDHVVIGSHGREGVSRLLLGSVAEKVVRRSPVPITVVR